MRNLALSFLLSIVIGLVHAESMPPVIDHRMPKAGADLQPFLSESPNSAAQFEASWPVAKRQLPTSHKSQVPRQIGFSLKDEVGLPTAWSQPTLSWSHRQPQHALTLKVKVRGAQALRVGMKSAALRKAVRIVVADPVLASVEGRGTALSETNIGMHFRSEHTPEMIWTPVTRGDEQVIEIVSDSELPSLSAMTLIGDVSVFLEDPFLAEQGRGIAFGDAKALTCNVNYTCTTNASYQTAGRAVARMVINRGASGFLCTGALIADVPRSGGYFATAHHCIATGQEALNTQFFWFYDQVCGSNELVPQRTSTIGAQLIRTVRDHDFTLLRMTQALPSGLVQLGWTSAATSLGESVYAIHHPDGFPKALSLGNISGESTRTALLGGQPLAIPAQDVRFFSGIVEPGSSGSPLISGEGVLRGTLSMGPLTPTCSNPVGYYSKFSNIYPLVRAFLNPGTVDDAPNSPAAVTQSSPLNGSLTGFLNTQSDQDWFRYSLPSRGTWFLFSTDFQTGTTVDTVGTLYGSNGSTILDSNDNDPVGLFGRNFAFYNKVLSPGNIFLRVTGAGGATGPYVVNSSFYPEDDHEDVAFLGTQIGTGVTRSGAVSREGDQDWFYFDLPTQQLVTISTTGSTDVVGGLYNAALVLLDAADDISQSNLNFQITRMLPAGRYYVQVIGYPGSPLGSYNLSLSGNSGTAPALQGAWWGGPSENGWGLSFIQHGNTLVAGWYLYNNTGQPTWYIMPGCTWNASFTTCNGNVVAATGSWLGAYNSAQFQSNVIGTVSFSFTNATTGTMSWVVNGIAGQKNISKIQFGSGNQPTATNYTDVWWGGAAQNGWGVAIIQEGAQLAGAWYTFNQAGQPVWYLFNGGTWTTPTTHTASLFRSTGSPLIGAVYNPNALVTVNAGTVTFSFTGASTANMTYTVDGVTQSKPIERLPF